MLYEFFLQKFRLLQCVRLPTCEWEATQKWILLNVSFVEEYHKTRFTFTVEKTSPVALILSVSELEIHSRVAWLTRISLTRDISKGLKEFIALDFLSR
jgi:hypothetical protein